MKLPKLKNPDWKGLWASFSKVMGRFGKLTKDSLKPRMNTPYLIIFSLLMYHLAWIVIYSILGLYGELFLHILLGVFALGMLHIFQIQDEMFDLLKDQNKSMKELIEFAEKQNDLCKEQQELIKNQREIIEMYGKKHPEFKSEKIT